MQFGKSIVGALVGGLIGIAALIGIYLVTGWDKAWLAIIVAIFTGVGVRWFAATQGHPSYARGALTALVAILAFLAWYPIVAQISIRNAPSKPIKLDTVRTPEEPAAAGDAAADTVPVDEPPPVDTGPRMVGMRGRPAGQQSVWDLIWLCIAGLIAYELGRGAAAASPATGMMGSPDDGGPAPTNPPLPE